MWDTSTRGMYCMHRWFVHTSIRYKCVTFFVSTLAFLSCVKSRVSSSNCTSTLGCLIDCISLFLICVTRCLADGILLDGRTTPPVEKAVQLKFVQDYVQDFVTMKFAIFVFLSKRL